MATGLSHIAICVPDLERGRAFYSDMFGFELLDTLQWPVGTEMADYTVGLNDSAAKGYVMKGANCYLEIWQYSAPQPQGEPAQRGANDYGIRHLAFEVENVEEAVERLLHHGGSIMNPPKRVPEIPSMSEELALYCRDPFGNILELLEVGKYFPRLVDL